MTSALTHPMLSQLSQLLEKEMGLYYPTKSWADLERRITAAAPALGMTNAQSCIRRLLSTPLTRRQVEILACHLTVGETYFFREMGSFGILEERIFPELMLACARSRRPLRIWSAGCCTGEEPYTIAILLDRLNQHNAVNATILATDINPIFLEKAATGLYGEWSFRGTPAAIKERYFKRRKNDQFEILPHIRKRVTFSYLNLAEETYPNIINGTDGLDVIFCRNVLMYFSPDRVTKIGQSFYRSLVDGGWLVLSPVEVATASFPQFQQTAFPTGIFYHKIRIIEPAARPVKQQGPISDSERNGITKEQTLAPTLSVQNEKKLLFPGSAGTKRAIETAPALSAQAAEQHCTAIPESEEEFEAIYDTARRYANLGKLTEAVIWCEKAIAANKLDTVSHYLLATVCQELGQNTKAIRSLRSALYLDPDFVLAHFALANLCMAQGRLHEAVCHFDNALALLALRPYDELLPESNGLTARGLADIITSLRRHIGAESREREAQ